MRLIDADSICFDELKNDFDRARAKVIIMGQPTIDFVTEERCREIAKELIPPIVKQAKAEVIKGFVNLLIDNLIYENYSKEFLILLIKELGAGEIN